jgi:hypothetical protein
LHYGVDIISVQETFGWLSHQAPTRPSCPPETRVAVAHWADSSSPGPEDLRRRELEIA